ncbi:MAG: DNA replication/repair protein RecF [Acidimicrobiales bacterium]
MGLHELTLRDFRLFTELSFTPDPDAVTVLLSANGTGKTSVLEAVYALATAASFRSASAGDMIRAGADLAEVHGVLYQRERRVQVDLTLARGSHHTTKRMLVNGQRPRSRADVAEALPLTVFTPEGVDVIRQGPEHRRAYLTHLVTDVDPSTSEIVERFQRVLSQRNALLRALEGRWPTPAQRDELDVWSIDFAQVSLQLVAARVALVDQLAPLVSGAYHALAETDQAVALAYERSWAGELLDALEGCRDEDRARGHTTIGPQRDDLAVTLDGRDARRQSSQGEQRSLALALRLAGHELVRARRGVDPLLLLDDVFSELDPQRAQRLLRLLPAGQTLVTTASPLPAGLTPAAVVDLTAVRA